MIARALFGLSLCLVVTGCGEDSKHPLSDPQTSIADERLIGIWRSGDDYMHVGHAGKKFPKGVMRMVEVTQDQTNVDPPVEYLLFPTTLGNQHYLNVVIDGKQVKCLDENGWKTEAVESYLLVRYRVDGDTVIMHVIDRTAKEQAIKDGKVKGVIEKDIGKFTDSTENVARFVAAAGERLWNTKEPMPFERVVVAPSSKVGSQATPTPPLRPLGAALVVDKNGIIWDHGKAVGIWGVEQSGQGKVKRR